jgi:hypothetical protein
VRTGLEELQNLLVYGPKTEGATGETSVVGDLTGGAEVEELVGKTHVGALPWMLREIRDLRRLLFEGPEPVDEDGVEEESAERDPVGERKAEKEVQAEVVSARKGIIPLLMQKFNGTSTAIAPLLGDNGILAQLRADVKRHGDALDAVLGRKYERIHLAIGSLMSVAKQELIGYLSREGMDEDQVKRAIVASGGPHTAAELLNAFIANPNAVSEELTTAIADRNNVEPSQVAELNPDTIPWVALRTNSIIETAKRWLDMLTKKREPNGGSV